MTAGYLKIERERNMELVDQMLEILAETVDTDEYDRFVSKLVNLAWAGKKNHERLQHDLNRLKRFGFISCCYC